MSEIRVTMTTPEIERVTLELTADEARAVSRVLNAEPAEKVAEARLSAAKLLPGNSFYDIGLTLKKALA